MSLFSEIKDAKTESESPMEGDVSTQEAGQAQSVTWWMDEKTPGVGERPTWLPENFKRVSDIAKSYSELQKKFGEAPPEYNLAVAEKWIEPEYEPIQEMLDYARSKRVPQDVMDKILSSVGSYIEEFNIDMEEEKRELGDNVQERLQVLDNWAHANFSPEAYSALVNSMNTASSIKAIEEIRKKMIEGNTLISGNTDTSADSRETIYDIEHEMVNNLKQYNSDPKYRKEIMRRIEMASQHEKRD